MPEITRNGMRLFFSQSGDGVTVLFHTGGPVTDECGRWRAIQTSLTVVGNSFSTIEVAGKADGPQKSPIIVKKSMLLT